MSTAAIVRKTWSALDGRLVFDISLGSLARGDDPQVFAVAEVRCGYDPVETLTIDIERNRPTDFKLRFNSGCKIEGILQGPGRLRVDGAEGLGIFADMRFCAPSRADLHFEGLLVTCHAPPFSEATAG